jgi:hypothetical protein
MVIPSSDRNPRQSTAGALNDNEPAPTGTSVVEMYRLLLFLACPAGWPLSLSESTGCCPFLRLGGRLGRKLLASLFRILLRSAPARPRRLSEIAGGRALLRLRGGLGRELLASLFCILLGRGRQPNYPFSESQHRVGCREQDYPTFNVLKHVETHVVAVSRCPQAQLPRGTFPTTAGAASPRVTCEIGPPPRPQPQSARGPATRQLATGDLDATRRS